MDDTARRAMDDTARRAPRDGDGAEAGGDPVCWLERVCAECGGLAEDTPPSPCTRCGAEVPAV